MIDVLPYNVIFVKHNDSTVECSPLVFVGATFQIAGVHFEVTSVLVIGECGYKLVFGREQRDLVNIFLVMVAIEVVCSCQEVSFIAAVGLTSTDKKAGRLPFGLWMTTLPCYLHA